MMSELIPALSFLIGVLVVWLWVDIWDKVRWWRDAD